MTTTRNTFLKSSRDLSPKVTFNSVLVHVGFFTSIGIPLSISLSTLSLQAIIVSPRSFSSSSVLLDESKTGPSADSAFVPITDLEWEALSSYTQSICLLIWDSKDKVPSGFLTDPKYSDQYKTTETIYSKVTKHQEGAVTAENPDHIFLSGVVVSRSLAWKADYVVEDPSNKGVALYLDAEGFRKLQNSCISARKDLNILQHPTSNKLKFPPRKVTDIANSWIRRSKRKIFPLLATDVFSWAHFIHPTIASRSDLERAEPQSSSAKPLYPNSDITKCTGYLVKCFSTLQGVIFLHSIPADIAWSMLALVLSFHHLWYYSSLKHACAYFKEANRLVYKYLAGTPERVSKGVILSIDKHGLPKIIPTYMRAIIRAGQPAAIAGVLFCLAVPRMYVFIGADKLSTITDPPTLSPELLAVLTPYIPMVFQTIETPRPAESWGGEFTDESVKEKISPLGAVRYFYTNKAGPNGHALLSAIFDAVAILTCPRLLYLIGVYANLVNAPRFVTTVARVGALTRQMVELVETSFDVSFPVPLVGKISRVFTAFGKVRLIAIPAYYIQMLFRPLHLLVFTILRRIPTDCTFDQDAGVRRVAEKGGDSLMSYDLSAATDRLPLSIQIPVVVCLAVFCGHPLQDAIRIGECWAEIIRCIPFSFSSRSRKGSKPRLIKYATGHPMGTYSSWAVFSLTHHLLTQICAYIVLLGGSVGSIPRAPSNRDDTQYDMESGLAKKYSKSAWVVGAKNCFNSFGWYMSYQLLGDDIVLFTNNPFELEVSKVYFWLLNLIGVEINPAKGVISNNGSFEFAKRFVRRGVHLNNMYWGEWGLTLNPFDFVARMRTMLSRGFQLPPYYTCVAGAICLLPINYKGKRDLVASFMAPISVRKTFLLPNKGYHKYLLGLVLSLLLMIYKVDIRLWVRMSMGTHPLPDWRTPLASIVPTACYELLHSLRTRIELLLKDVTSKSFSFRMNLPTICIKVWYSLFVKWTSRARPGDITISIGSFAEVFKTLASAPFVFVLLCLSPPFKVMSFLKVFSNNVIFPEAGAYAKYKRSVSNDPDEPYEATERWTSNEHTVTMTDTSYTSPSSALRLIRLISVCLYAYECLSSAFNVSTYNDDAWYSGLADFHRIPEFRAVMVSAAARLLIMYDGMTYDRPRIDPLRSLGDGSTTFNSYSAFGSQDSIRKEASGGKRKVIHYEGLGTFSPSFRTVEEEPILRDYRSLDYTKVRNRVVKTLFGENGTFSTMVPARDS